MSNNRTHLNQLARKMQALNGEKYQVCLSALTLAQKSNRLPEGLDRMGTAAQTPVLELIWDAFGKKSEEVTKTAKLSPKDALQYLPTEPKGAEFEASVSLDTPSGLIVGDKVSGYMNPNTKSVTWGNPKSPRIMAHFRPQASMDDYAIDVDGEYDFDITEQVLAMGRQAALQVEDHSYESDAWWQDNAISEEQPWNGPFEVEAEDAIKEYFSKLSDVSPKRIIESVRAANHPVALFIDNGYITEADLETAATPAPFPTHLDDIKTGDAYYQSAAMWFDSVRVNIVKRIAKRKGLLAKVVTCEECSVELIETDNPQDFYNDLHEDWCSYYQSSNYTDCVAHDDTCSGVLQPVGEYLVCDAHDTAELRDRLASQPQGNVPSVCEECHMTITSPENSWEHDMWCPVRADIQNREKLAQLEAEFEAAGGRGVELADEIDFLRKVVSGDVEWADEDLTFTNGGNPGCDCGQEDAVVRVGSSYLGYLEALSKGLRPPKYITPDLVYDDEDEDDEQDLSTIIEDSAYTSEATDLPGLIALTRKVTAYYLIEEAKWELACDDGTGNVNYAWIDSAVSYQQIKDYLTDLGLSATQIFQAEDQ